VGSQVEVSSRLLLFFVVLFGGFFLCFLFCFCGFQVSFFTISLHAHDSHV
jgi:hypothetical protein